MAPASGTMKTRCGLPMLTAAGGARPKRSRSGPSGTASVSTSSRSGISRQPNRGRPMSTVNVVGPSRRHRTSCPSMSSRRSVRVLSCSMNQATQRVPLPQAPARDPSLL